MPSCGIVKVMIGIAKPEIGEEEIAAVNAVMKSGILAQGERVAELEKRFSEYCGTKHAIAVNSGTAAIHAALHAAGVGKDDEVITVPFSFIATINPILMVGAKPVLVDIEPDSYCMDTSQLEAAITPKTKAIVIVHLYGQPANMDEVIEIASRNNLKVIEDACQAVGAEYGGKKAGNLGDIGCFSLYATKNIMCGEGGMVTTNDDSYAESIRRFRQHGMSAPYVYEELGFNYRMTDLQAAIAIEQLKKVDRFNEARNQNANYLNNALADEADIVLPTISSNRTHVFHQYTIRIVETSKLNRDEVVNGLREQGVGAGVYYPRALHLYPHIKDLGFSEGDFPVSEEVASRVLSLPVHPALTQEDLQTVASAVKETLRAH